MHDDSVLLAQLADDYSARVRSGQMPDIEAEYAARHPALAERIRALFPTLMLLEGLAAGRTTARTSSPAIGALGPGATFGPYRIEREIGRGGMGVVYEAVHQALARRVALKVLPAAALEAGGLERFLREAQTAAGLHHTNIVPVFDLGQVSGVPFYAMQLIAGHGLDGVAGRRPPVAQRAFLRQVAGWGLQAAQGLAHAHERGVVHRDIKPSNLLLDEQGIVWITDFGLARRSEDVALTKTGALLGTPRYMSPEQAQAASKPVDHRSDVYSLGATLYELATGQPAFDGPTPLEVVLAILERNPVAPHRLEPAIPRDLETIILKAMARRPEDRYQSAQGMADDLRRFLEDEPIHARRIGPVGRFVRWSRRNPALAGLGAVSVMTTFLLLVTGVFFNAQLQIERHRVNVTQRFADDASRDVQQLRRSALETNRRAEQRLGQANLAAAFREARHDLGRSSLVFLAEAVKTDASDPARANVHRRRFRAFASQHARPVAAFFHEGWVLHAAFSPDGKRVATASADGSARVWDVASGKPVTPPLRHTRAVTRVVYGPDGRFVLTACSDRTVRAWSVVTGQPTTAPLGYVGKLLRLEFSPDGRLIVARMAGRDPEKVRQFQLCTAALALMPPPGNLVVAEASKMLRYLPHQETRCWSAETGQEFRQVRDWQGAHFHDDGRALVVTDGSARILDIRTGRLLLRIHADGIQVHRALFSPDGRGVLTVSRDLKRKKPIVQFWDAGTGKSVRPTLDCDEEVAEVTFSPDGKWILLKLESKTLAWDVVPDGPVAATSLKDLKPTAKLERISPDGRLLVTSDRDSFDAWFTEVWDTYEARPVVRIPGEDERVEGDAELPTYSDPVYARSDEQTERITEGMEFSPDSGRILAFGRGARIREAKTRDLVIPPLPCNGFATFSPDGRHVLAVRNGKEMKAPGAAWVWDMARGQPAFAFPSTEAPDYRQAIFSPDGKRVFTVGGWRGDNRARLWDVSAARPLPLSTLSGSGRLHSPRFSPNGRFALALDGENRPRVWELARGQEITPSLPGGEPLKQAEFSPDGDRLLIRTGQGGAAIWDLPTRRLLFAPPREPDAEILVVFRPDGRRFVVWSRPTRAGRGPRTTTVHVRDTVSGRVLAKPITVEGVVERITFSKEGRHLLTFSKGAARVWHAGTGQPATPSFPHQTAEYPPILTPDGTKVVTLREPGKLQIWDARSGRPHRAPLPHDRPGWKPVLSPDGRYLVTIEEKGAPEDRAALRIFDTNTGQVVFGPFTIWRHFPDPLTFSPSGKRAVIAGRDHVRHVWDGATGESRILSVEVPNLQFSGVDAFSPDGNLAVIRDFTRTSWFRWYNDVVIELTTGQPVTPIRELMHGDVVAISPDGRWLLTEAPARLWDLSADERPAEDVVLLAQLLTGQRLGAAGNLEPLGVVASRQAWEQMRQRYPADFALASADDMLEWNRYEAFAALGWVREVMGVEVDKEWSPARWHLDRLIRARPDAGPLYASRGEASTALGDWDRAIADYRQAVRRGDAQPHTWHHLALVYLCNGDEAGYRKACEEYFRAFPREAWTSPDERGHRLPAFVLGPGGLVDRAALLREAEERAKRPGRTQADLRWCGAVFYRADRWDEAARCLEQLWTKNNMGYQWDALLLAMAHHRRGRTDLARHWLTRAKTSAFARERAWNTALEVEVLRLLAEDWIN